ncbi:MAG: hypothetical protein KA740_06185 [Rhodoferax sp.]|nr:hypothetical protein [Rhodoferax sp.]
MTQATLINFGPPLHPLGARQPRQRGAGGIEALSSYISGQALDHSCSPYTLFSSVLIPAEEKLNARWRRVQWGESQLINGYGEVASAVVNAVEASTGIVRVNRMSLGGLEAVCDPIAKHLLHPTRPWCTVCYLEARERNVPAWDALYTYLRTTKVCAWHGVNLVFFCSKCGMGQRYLPKFPFLDYCECCGADLATQITGKENNDPRLIDAKQWIARAALDMVDNLSRETAMTSENFVGNVRALMDGHFQGMERPFALRLGLAGSSPKNWVKRGSAPTWSSLVDLAYRLDIPPAQLCSVEPALTDPQYWRQLPPASLDKPHVRPSSENLAQVRSELQRRLELEDVEDIRQVEGLPRLAKRLQVSLGVLKRNFPEECSRLVAQRAALLRAKRLTGDAARAQRMSDAIAAVTDQGLPPTSRNLKGTGRLRVSDMVARSAAVSVAST